MTKYLLAWVPMVIIAVANGALRVTTFARVLPELRAHQLSTATGIVFMGAYIWLVIRLWPPATPRQALAVGGLWVVLTVAFEFVFGRLVMGNPWPRLLHDYDLLAGRLWLVFLAWLAAAPWLFLRLQGTR
jgi:hypothetical protein